MSRRNNFPQKVLCFRNCCIVAQFLFFILTPIISQAAVWDNEIGLGVDLGYVDNITLETSGNEESEYVSQIYPFIRLNGDGNRLDFDLIYRMQIINYSESDNDNAIYHQLFSELNTELLEQLFYVDLTATNSQSAINAETPIPQDNISITNNRTNITTATVSPYISTRILSEIDLLIRYRYIYTKYEDVVIADPTVVNQELTGSIASVDSPVDWRISYFRNEFNTNLVSSNYYEDASFTLLYDINTQLIPYATIGNERNRIINTSFDEGGVYWNIGLAWQPTPRTSISADYGRRFYGTTYGFDWRTRGRRTNVNITYTEEITNAGSVFAGQPPPGSLPPGGENEFIPISIRPFIRKRMESNINYRYSKTNLNLYIFGENRKFLTGLQNEENNYGATMAWLWSLTARTRPSLTIGWQNIRVEVPDLSDNKLWNITLGITHNTSERIRSSINYRYLSQDSTNILNNYKQNVVSAGIVILFEE